MCVAAPRDSAECPRAKYLPTYCTFCHAPGEPPAATTCAPGTRQDLAGPGRRCPARSAIASCIFGSIGPIAQPAGHAQGVQFGL